MALHVLGVMRPLVRWLVRGGIGYTEFASALKSLFLQIAKEELEQEKQKINDSRLSLLSGLHRKDVRALGAASEFLAQQPQMVRATPQQQVVTRWLSNEWPLELPFSGGEQSFENLALSVSRDFHPRALLSELLRLQVVQAHYDESGETIVLCREAFMPNRNAAEAHQLVSANLSDHMNAAVHNLTAKSTRQYLEQAVFADGLSAESAHQLERLTTKLWKQAMKKMVDAAIPLCEKDEGKNGSIRGTHRIRMGMFCFATDTQNDAVKDLINPNF